MKKFGAKGQRWVKSFHVFFACVWIGAAVCLILISFFLQATDGKELYGIDRSLKFIDDFIIIPGAIGSFLTGLIYAIFTNWGFFKHNWIIVKWIICIGGIIFGTFWLGPWLNHSVPISGDLGLGALSDPAYVHNKTMNLWFGTLQGLTLIFAAFISVFKPWKKKKGKANTGS
ncbi:MAG: hypothetical protein JRG97_06475 [Deltaproteobacteria bacterium]|nr:hypothetical protein [Deltaproteobacteria bacterium]MBW2052080.1 hypothetical protein [Deltaproteobacteria bacterium]MBW2140701.1 hypothetical protein [Deltaproteobacteria bacterium]MBW2322339.1 hypothetical protein [Deltaproteobacteria bacterium]